jgi:uncharacterized repeat protein (TIGR01451 family)
MSARRTIFASTVVALTAAVVAALAVSAGMAPAGNRNPQPTLVGFPGPGEVTYGQNVAYTATLPNAQSSTFTHVQFHDPIPTTVSGSQTLTATLKYASCQGQLTATEFVCNEISVPSKQTAKVTIVWQTPAAGSSVGCSSATPVCMTNSSFWTIKEGTGNPGSSGPDTFPSPLVSTSLLLVPNPAKAGGYALTACTNALTQTSLETNPAVGPTNKLATRVCASTVPGQVFDPGVAIEIEEGPGSGITESATVCIPAPGQSCDSSSYAPWIFSPRATFTFTIDNTTLPKGEKVDTVFHDSVDVTADCTITISNKTKTTIVSCLSDRNGDWRFG